jgi:uncharacterized protein (TIGR02594 family)
MGTPAWLDSAWAEFGVSERAGAGDDPAVVRYFAESGHASVRDDETPWCAAFLGAMLKRAGIKGTGSLLARSYLKWGDALNAPKLGCIAVLSRGTDPAAGHVGFYLGGAPGRVILLGGNQGNAVSVTAFADDRVLGFRWPKDHAAPIDVPRDDFFQTALKHILKMEGGFTNDPHDPGGPTNYGITLRVYAAWMSVTLDASSHARLLAELRAIKPETVAAIYRKRYFEPARCAELPRGLAAMHFDAAVNHGVGGAARFLQQAVGTDVDGEIGPLTLAAARRMSEADVIARYADLRRARYRALPHFWRFGRGWLNRVNATTTFAQSHIGKAASTAKEPSAAAKSVEKEVPMQQIQMPIPEPTPTPATAPRDDDAKWWGHSKTMWGAIISAAATLIPVFGPMVGIYLPGDLVRDIGEKTLMAVQAATALFGAFLTVYGRLKADKSLSRRTFNVRM